MKHVHLIGIGGTGLSAIAQVLLEKGYRVSGSDREVSSLFKAITAAGAQTYLGHAPDHIAGADLVIRSSAIPDTNPEVLAARARGIPVLKRQEFLQELTAGKQTLAVAGTHGKTTTTSMLIYILHEQGLDPSYISGGVISQLKRNAHAGSGPHFVIEADEYDHMFLGLTPKIAVITNIEHDHADCFPTLADYQAAFLAFAQCVHPEGKLIFCHDDPGARGLFADRPDQQAQIFTYGTGPSAHYQAEKITFIDGYPQFELLFKGKTGQKTHLGSVTLHVPGRHNVLNAIGVLAVVHQLGLPLPDAIQALSAFSGAGRRFEVLGQAGGVTVINDYGHHPTEMAATLEAARSRYPGRRIWAVWQPHTYSRTQSLAQRFVEALSLADKVMVLKIYAAREADPGYSAEQVASALPKDKVTYQPDFDRAANVLLENVASDDIILIFSAGDALQLSQMVLNGLQQQEQTQQELHR
ncbi:MAG: UDP-N-acetylmuramate--L-alanine ligase [Brevefilum sp.]